MRRHLPLLLVLAALGSACVPSVGGPQTAAVINGEAIAVADIEPLVAGGQAAVDPTTGQPAAEEDLAVQAISNLALVIIASQQLDELGGERVTDADVDEALAQTIEAGGGQQAFDDQLAAQGVDIETVRFDQRFQLVITRLTDLLAEQAAVGEEEVQAAYDAQFALPEVSHILVATEAEAQDALARLEAGEDFAAVASEISIDPGSGVEGGALGALQPGAFVPEFEAAALALEPGTVSDPVETQFGFHLITTSAPPPLDDAVRAQISDQLAQQQVQTQLTELVFGALEDADADVNPRFGVWAPEIGPDGGLLSIVAATDPLGELVPVTLPDAGLPALPGGTVPGTDPGGAPGGAPVPGTAPGAAPAPDPGAVPAPAPTGE